MPRVHLRLRLRPLIDSGESTWMSLSGPLPTMAGIAELRAMIEALSICTGEPVRVVLFAVDRDGWSERCLRELSRVPDGHRELRVRLRRRRVERFDEEQLELFGGER